MTLRLGDFPDYISGEKKFSVPVYAVWGNHEDVQVLRQLNTNLSVENLHVLDEHHLYQFHTDGNELEFSLYGLGGNFLVSKKLFDKQLPVMGERFGRYYINLALCISNLKTKANLQYLYRMLARENSHFYHV